MDFESWEPIYVSICEDMGYDPSADEAAVRVLESVTLMSDLRDADSIESVIGPVVTVAGGASCLAEDVDAHRPEGTLICAGSAAATLSEAGLCPDIQVTDLDGDIDSQLEFSREGCLTLILAHGDNVPLIQRHAPEFRGPVVLTTQSRPRGNVLGFGGFTDGDRAVCLARHFGARRIVLLGFDFDDPSDKKGSTPEVKRRKLSWARRIIFDGRDDVVLP